MLRNRLTHALEVAAVGVRIAASTGMNMSLTEAIGTGHDCGHGPGGHAAEEAFDIYLPEGFDHAKWGADETLKPLNLTEETLDGIRQHSWKLDAPSTMEGEIISWSDRIAYVVADWNDAVRAQILPVQSLPDEVNEAAGHTTEAQLKYFCEAIATCIKETGLVGMHTEPARILDLYRKHNYERIYLRPASMEQAGKVVSVLRQLTDYYIDAPGQIPEIIANPELFPASGSPEAAYYAVRYVASMTDRYAFRQAQELLRLHDSELPQSV
jgi:dGTPase